MKNRFAKEMHRGTDLRSSAFIGGSYALVRKLNPFTLRITAQRAPTGTQCAESSARTPAATDYNRQIVRLAHPRHARLVIVRIDDVAPVHRVRGRYRPPRFHF